jgi:hypothetical protein
VMEEQTKKSLMLVILEPNRKNWAKVIHTSLDLSFYSCSDAPHFLSVCPFEGTNISGLTCRCNNVSKTRKVEKWYFASGKTKSRDLNHWWKGSLLWTHI